MTKLLVAARGRIDGGLDAQAQFCQREGCMDLGTRYTQLLGADNAYKASFNLVCTTGYTFNALLRAIKVNFG